MSTDQAPLENVQRGALFALLAIPVAAIAFGIVGWLFGISGIVAILVPYVAVSLYKKGAGAPLTRAGWAPFIAISAAAIIVGVIAGIGAGTYRAYTSVGGSGLTSAFWTAFGGQFTSGLADNAIAILIGLGLGFAGIFGVIRGPRTPAGQVSPNVLPPVGGAQPPADYTAPQAPQYVAPPAAPPAAPAAPAAPIAPNQPSPGVILNGKPVDPPK